VGAVENPDGYCRHCRMVVVMVSKAHEPPTFRHLRNVPNACVRSGALLREEDVIKAVRS
jgi:hypothetical protein